MRMCDRGFVPRLACGSQIDESTGSYARSAFITASIPTRSGSFRQPPKMKRDSGTKVSAVAIVVAALGFCAAAQDWPGFQGLDRHGVLISAAPPVNWAKEHNVNWRTPLPGKGYSSPVVFGYCSYVTTAYDSY